MTYVMNLFARRRWFDLVPDRAHAVLVSGYGTESQDGKVNDSDYATAARTPDGALFIAYLPTQRTVAVDMSKLPGRVRARWYDPTTGAFLPVAGSPFANADTRRFTPPGRNGDGDDDWVLVLTA
jgi:Putative collagen-binding domain of a collagenase